ncbi:MAG: hypothetical protein ACJ76T_21020 [Solirubrobacteraceae bacterium]
MTNPISLTRQAISIARSAPDPAPAVGRHFVQVTSADVQHSDPRIDRRAASSTFDAFLSYSHAVDGRLAPALERGLELMAKPWYRRRGLRNLPRPDEPVGVP